MQRNFWFFGLVATLLFLTTAGCDSQTVPTAPANPPASSPTNHATASPTAGAESPDVVLFNGKDLTGWKETDFGGHGEVLVKDGIIEVSMGGQLTGFHWTNAAVLPKINYEIELDAMKREGHDFFCGLTFPVNNSFCSLIIGGWGGSVVGISSLDGADASENDTSTGLFFERNRWHHIRLRVQSEKIMVWIDKDKVIDVGIAGRKISMRSGDIELSIPLGFATWQTSASYRNLSLKKIPVEAAKP